MSGTSPGPDGLPRCAWCTATAQYLRYHDTEWGFPVADDRHLFEKLCLESFQSGLSWRTILEKRENFRAAFAGFDFYQMAEFTEADITRLLADKGIIRHRGKIEAVINNAKRACALVAEAGSLARFLWGFAPSGAGAGQQAAKDLANALKKRGWAFIGPTTSYAFMQSMGLVNDHAPSCAIRPAVEQARAAFTKPA
ncbi:DNA-3-methyladenine glycosylase I [Acidocella sp.]|uniref:DNA-3-methyladenine glycosylase I n=1 Tax=Acidocella sp. TaxID=50710 RepID=UPI002610AD41|nr:DNA-3-methyladenine glycosylase I [Acidocella sp.]